jgi:phytoene/squalene synthetase
MPRSVLDFLPWARTTNDIHPSEPLDGFADLMRFYKEQLPQLRPANHNRIEASDPAKAAQIDGLIVSLLLIDGLLCAQADHRAGRPLRLPTSELAEYQVEPAHFEQRTVDFAWRRLCERYIRRSRDLLQAAAILGKPLLSGMTYRLCIARAEQVLREIQVDPATAYLGGRNPKLMDRLTAMARIMWRTLTGRR